MTSSSGQLKIAVLGSGAMGSVFGGRLTQVGGEVTLVDPWREHMEAVASDGLVLEEPDGTGHLTRPSALHDPRELGPVDAVIVLTKGFATREAAESIAHAVGPETVVATLQNGLGLDEVLADVFTAEQVAAGTTTVGAEIVAPGRTRMTPATAAGEAVTHLSRPRGAGGTPETMARLVELLEVARLPTQVYDGIGAMVWTKLSMAASMAPMTAILDCKIGEVWGSEHGRVAIREIFDEIMAVAAAEGVELDVDEVWAHCATTWDNCPDHHTSMQFDLSRGRRTEIDTFSLEIARRAREHGIAAGAVELSGRLVEMISERGRASA